ncbi:MAG: hypothetical protein LUE06_08310 [Oscillospiraceae bacterium]|nr:hypothetical protein [Oscillospiraceae bacterium]
MSKFSAKRFTAAAVSVAVIFSLSATAFAANEERAEVPNTEGAYVAAGRTFSDEIVWGSESALKICLTDGSVFTGSFRREADAEGGFANLYIDSGSKWVVTADSALTSLYGDGVIVDTEGRTVTIAGINGEVYSAGEGERTVTVERCSLTESAGEGAAALKWLCGAGVLPAEEASAQSTPMALLMARLAENVKQSKSSGWTRYGATTRCEVIFAVKRRGTGINKCFCWTKMRVHALLSSSIIVRFICFVTAQRGCPVLLWLWCALLRP